MKEFIRKLLNTIKQKKRKRTHPLKHIGLTTHLLSMKQNASTKRMGWVRYIQKYGYLELDQEKCRKELNESYLAVAYGLKVAFISHKHIAFISFYRGTESLMSVMFFTNDYPIIKWRCDGFIGMDFELFKASLEKAMEKATDTDALERNAI